MIAALAFALASAIPVVESASPAPPQSWAVLERRLIDVMSEAALDYAARYTRSGGTLVWKTSGFASLDDLPESFYNFPLLYALGGDERLRELSFREWSATVRQLTYDFPIYHREFPKYGDWFHIGEGIIYFYYLALADPTDHELVDRARRFAGLYLNETAEAQNYDPKLRMIRGAENGSLGPLLDYKAKGCPCILPPWYGSKPEEAFVSSVDQPPAFHFTEEMAGYGLPLEDIPGIRDSEALKNPANARLMGEAVMKRLYPGDVPVNLGATSLVLNAYLLTGEQRYADWVREYTAAWLERTRRNGGITPDNIGPSGRVGELHNGSWWGGLYGWRWPHGYHSVGQALHLAAANTMLVTGGDTRFLELPRSNLDYLMKLGKQAGGRFVIPTRKSSAGWDSWGEIDGTYLAALWFMSLDRADWDRIEKVRAAGSHDWRRVISMRNKMDTGHEAPWLRYLVGDNPGYPEQILESSLGQVAERMERIHNNVLLMDTDPAGLRKVDPDKVDLTQVSEHNWQLLNPVTTEALVQLMLGAPQIMYNGGLLHASVRYFDPVLRRPGLPKGVAALVSRIDGDGITVQLVNTDPFEARNTLIQAGTFGEHQFTFARTPESKALTQINGKYLLVKLAPGAAIKLELGMQRFRHKPAYAFPWHGDRIPVR